MDEKWKLLHHAALFDIIPMMENQMGKNVEHEIETEAIGFSEVRCLFLWLCGIFPDLGLCARPRQSQGAPGKKVFVKSSQPARMLKEV